MKNSKSVAEAPTTGAADAINEMKLAGRLTRDPEVKLLPSGDEVVLVRISVPRRGARGRPASDWIDCAIWKAGLRQRAVAWREGDWVGVEGALRRRFFRTSAGPQTRLEVEVARGRVTRRLSQRPG